MNNVYHNAASASTSNDSSWQQPKQYGKKLKRSADNQIELENMYELLSDSSDEDLPNNDKSNMRQKKSKAPPPIIVYSLINNHSEKLKEIKKNLKGELNIKCKGSRLALYTENMDDYKFIKNEAEKSKLEFHTYTPNEDRILKMVLRNMPPNITPEEITEELKMNELKPINITQMTKKSSDNVLIKLPLYIITFVEGTKASQVKKVKKICYCIVEWEKLRNNNKNVTQCYKCQSFWHIAANCYKQTKCAKCSEPHETKNCINEEVLKCSNCNENHAAFSKNCPVYAQQLENKLNRRSRPKTAVNKPEFTYSASQFPATSADTPQKPK